jgi:hypothetical protein
MSNIRNLPMTIGIAILVVAFIGSMRSPDRRDDHEDHDDYWDDDVTEPLSMEMEDIRALNRDNLKKLSVGMTKEQAMAIMGTRTFRDDNNEDFLVPNPYRSESYQAPDGTKYELLTYYTDWSKSDYKLTKDEMTPLIFEDGKLIGWGWVFVDKLDMRHATLPSAEAAPPAPPPTPPAELPEVEK